MSEPRSHFVFMDQVLCGVKTTNTTKSPRMVDCKNCKKSLKRRDREGDW